MNEELKMPVHSEKRWDSHNERGREEESGGRGREKDEKRWGGKRKG